MTATHTERVDIEQLVQTELAWSSSPHPRAIAERVAAVVDEANLRSALAAALVYVVRKVASRNRQAAAGVTGTPDAAGLLRQPVCLGRRGWSSYGRLTPSEVDEQVAWQRQLAERARAEALRLERIGEAMEAAEVRHVDELGLATLSAIFS